MRILVGAAPRVRPHLPPLPPPNPVNPVILSSCHPVQSFLPFRSSPLRVKTSPSSQSFLRSLCLLWPFPAVLPPWPPWFKIILPLPCVPSIPWSPLRFSVLPGYCWGSRIGGLSSQRLRRNRPIQGGRDMEMILLGPIFIFTAATFFRVDKLQKKQEELMREIEALKKTLERGNP